jgi:hypothetical protein
LSPLSRRSKNPQNQTFYSFGGKTPIERALNSRSNNQALNKTFTSIANSFSKEKYQAPRIIEKEPLVRVSDYTKNVS